jgi:hypothetical protein
MEGGSIALSPAAAGGRRHAKKVSAKTIRRTLKKLGMKPKGRVVLKGGMDAAAEVPAAEAPAAPEGGRRHRKTKKHSRKHRGFRLF